MVWRQLRHDDPVGRLDEAVIVEHAVGGERTDQADVGAFRRLNRTDPAVVGVMHIAHVEAGTVAAQSTGTEGGETPLMRQLGQRVGLVHELRELVAAEEFLHGSLHRADVDQRRGGGLVGVDDRHPLADHALHPHHADPELVLQLLADGADAAVAEVVDIVVALDAAIDRDLGEDDSEQVTHPERLLARLVGVLALGVETEPVAASSDLRMRGVEPGVDLVAADAAEVVAARVEELTLEHRASGLERGRVAGTEALVHLDHRPLFVAVIRADAGRFLLQRGVEELVHRVLEVDPVQHRADALVGTEQVLELLAVFDIAVLVELRVIGVIQRAQQGGHGDLALAVNLDGQDVTVGGFELEPGPARGDQLGRAERAAGGGVDRGAEVDAGRSHELGNDDALSAVDDEGAGLGHVRQVAEVEPLLLALAGLL